MKCCVDFFKNDAELINSRGLYLGEFLGKPAGWDAFVLDKVRTSRDC